MKTVAATAILAAGTAACANSDENASPTMVTTSPTADVSSDVERPGSVFAVAQYWPGTDRWPPPEPIGPQYWPGTDRWPPPEPIGPQYWPGTDRWPPPEPLGPQDWPAAARQPASSPASTDPGPSLSVATDEELVAAVTEVVGTAEAAYDAALRNPDDASLRQAIVDATVDGSSAQQELLASYDDHIAAGRWAEPHPDGIDNSVKALEEPTKLGDGFVGVVVCYVNGDQLLGTDEMGEPTLIDGSRNARVMLDIFGLLEGVWKLESRLEIRIIPEETSCEPEA